MANPLTPPEIAEGNKFAHALAGMTPEQADTVANAIALAISFQKIDTAFARKMAVYITDAADRVERDRERADHIAETVTREFPDADVIIDRFTPWKTVREQVLQDAETTYRPTCRLDLDPFAERHADIFDRCMELLGDERRAYRVKPDKPDARGGGGVNGFA